jgi:hypothetical protein
MAIGTLLGVEVIRANAKHVIALNADAMEHRFMMPVMMLAGLGFRGCMSLILGGHGWILPRGARITHRGRRRFRCIRGKGFRIFNECDGCNFGMQREFWNAK